MVFGCQSLLQRSPLQIFLGILAAPLVFSIFIPEDKIPINAKFGFLMKLRSVVSLRHNMAFTKLLQKGIQKFDFSYSSFNALKSKKFFWPDYFILVKKNISAVRKSNTLHLLCLATFRKSNTLHLLCLATFRSDYKQDQCNTITSASFQQQEKAIRFIYFVWQLLGVIISRTSVILLHRHHFYSKKINEKIPIVLYYISIISITRK